MITLGQDNTDKYLNKSKPILGEISSSNQNTDNPYDQMGAYEPSAPTSFSTQENSNPYDQMDVNAPLTSTSSRSTLGQMGTQLVGGVVSDFPKMLGQSIQAFADDTGEVEKLGKSIADYGISKEKGYVPDLAGKNEFQSTAIQAARAIPTSLAPQLLRVIPVVGNTLATGVTGALFGGQQFQQTKEKALSEGKSPEEAKSIGLKTGIVQGIGDMVMSEIGAAGLGVTKSAFGGVLKKAMGDRSITAAIEAATSPAIVKPFLKGMMGTIAGEALTEATQDELTNYIEREAGLKAQGLGEAAPTSAKVGGMMAAFLAPLGLHGHYKAAQRANAIGEVLDNPASATPEARMNVVNMLHEDAVKSGITTASKWLEEAKQAIATNSPIPRTTSGEEKEAAKAIQSKAKISSDALDMTTGKPIVNKDIAKLINTFDALHATQPDVTNEDYLKQKNAIRNSLNEMTNTPEGKTPDHVKIQEAESALKQIDDAHARLEREKAKADSSKIIEEPTAPVVESTAPVVEPTAPVVESTAPVVEPTAPITTEVKQEAPVVDQSAPSPEVVKEDTRTTLYHATPKEFDNLDVSKSTDFGIHLGDQATAQYIAETSNKNNIVSTKIDTSNFIELPDLDSWQTPDIIDSLIGKLNPESKAASYWSAQVTKLKNAYGIARQSKNPKLRVAQVNHELAKTLSNIGVDGIKYINDKEGKGQYSYILLKNPESIQKEGRVEKNREPDIFTPKVNELVNVKTKITKDLIESIRSSKPEIAKIWDGILEGYVSNNISIPDDAVSSLTNIVDKIKSGKTPTLSQVNEATTRLKDANKIQGPTKVNVSSITQPSIRKESGPKAVSSKRVRTSRQVSGPIVFTEETQSQITYLDSHISSLMGRLNAEKDNRLAGGEHLEDMTALASEVVQATTLRDNIIAENTPKVVKTKKVPTTPKQKDIKKKSTTKNSKAKVLVEVDEVEEVIVEVTGPSRKDLADITAELPDTTTGEGATLLEDSEQKEINALKEELAALKDMMIDKSYSKEDRDLARERVHELDTILGTSADKEKRAALAKKKAEAKARFEALKAELVEISDTYSQGDAIPTSSEFSDATTYIDDNGNLISELVVDANLPEGSFDKVGTFESFKNLLSAKTSLKVELIYLPSFSDATLAKYKITTRSAANTIGGLHLTGTDGNKSKVFINGSLMKSQEMMRGTLAHEILGHYGLRELFKDSEAYDNFLVNMLSNNPKLTNDILSLSKRWSSYLESWKVKYIKDYSKDLSNLEKKQLTNAYWKTSKEEGIPFDVAYQGPTNKEIIPREIAIQLADEYMAELAKGYVSNKEFMDRMVGMGLSISEMRNRIGIRKDREKWLNSFLLKIKHLLHSLFGNTFNHLSQYDLAQLIAQSIDNTFGVINPDALFGSDRPFSNPRVIPLEEGISRETNQPIMEDQLSEEEIVNHYTPSRIEDLQVFHDGVMSGFGSQTENVRSRFWNKLNESINNNSILSAFKALGNLNSQEAYEAMGTIFKGEISQAEDYVKGFTAAIKNLNSMQNQAVFEYFTTKDSDADLLPVTPIQRNAIVKAKESIRTIGRSLNELGLLDDETYAKNEDAYLHVVYLKYIDQYKGSNKKTSMLSWMKKRANKTDRERLALGEIKDVKFLVPETLGTMARDQVLLQMFDTIGKMSRENNLYWVMSKDIKIKYPGRRSKLTLEQAYEQLDQNKFILDMHDKNQTQEFGTAGKNALVEELRNNTATLEANIQSVATAEARMLQEAYEVAKERGETKAEDQSKFLLEQYVRLPNKKQMGALSNKWVRKEIANDLDAITGAYNLSDKNNIEKFFARGGTLERINQLWKMSMVALNPGSWVRNTMGNFSLLDLSTSTDKMKLISMLHEEISSAVSGEQSEYWKLATKYGLFGSTWSAIELQDIQSTYGSDLADAKKRFEARNGGSSLDKQLHFLDERLMSIGKMMGRKVGAATSKSYSLVEGAFKTVAMRDYINIWEEQNKEEFPEGYKSLTPDKAQIVLAKAATHANEAIFDYSQVNSMVKTLRRIPFGSPFITFTYKAGPAAVRAMVNHPIKFAQYATLPALMTMVAMAFNDWDDDDITKFKSALTDYQRLNPGIAFLPFKDAKGRPQVLGLDYMIPWSQYSTAARKIYENYIEDDGESPVSTSVKSVGTALNEFGFLGGPTPTGIAAMLSGKDDFTGRDIVTPGASASTQMGEAMLFAYNMAAPAWLSSHGWFSKMYDAFKDKPTTDRFGNIKFTPAQAISDITGFRATSVNVEAGRANRRLGFEMRLKEVSTLRGKVIKDRNETNKIGKIKDLNNREKLIRSQMMEALK